MATSMGVDRSGYVAAVAPNSGGMISETLPWQNDHTPALMTIHGASDMVIVNFVTTSATADRVYKARGAFVINCNHGGGHCGGSGQFASAWQFFMAHPFGVTPEPYAGGLPGGFSSVCQIY
jgi:hypothetical protein